MSDNDNTITLFLSAHGSTLPEQGVNIRKGLTCKLVSVAGATGIDGWMGQGDDSEEKVDSFLYMLTTCGYTFRTDEKLMKFDNKNTPEYNEEYEEKIKTIGGQLEEVLKKTGLLKELEKNKDNFKMYVPTSNRNFTFKPASGERCGETAEDILNTTYTGSYGLHVVHSTNANEQNYTLSGDYENDDIFDNSNIIPELTFIKGNKRPMKGRKFWKTKFTKSLKKTKLSDDEKEKAKKYYDSFINDREITLDRLITIFDIMGYNKIYIIDPSCRGINANSKIQESALTIAARASEGSLNTAEQSSRASSPRPLTPSQMNMIRGLVDDRINDTLTSPETPFISSDESAISDLRKDITKEITKEVQKEDLPNRPDIGATVRNRPMVETVKYITDCCPDGMCTISGGKIKRRKLKKKVTKENVR